MNAKQKQTIIAALVRKGAGMCKCPICGNPNWRIDEGVLNARLHPDVALEPGVGPSVLPCAVLTCSNCGFVRTHALGVLGVLVAEKKEEKPDEEFPGWGRN